MASAPYGLMPEEEEDDLAPVGSPSRRSQGDPYMLQALGEPAPSLPEGEGLEGLPYEPTPVEPPPEGLPVEPPTTPPPSGVGIENPDLTDPGFGGGGNLAPGGGEGIQPETPTNPIFAPEIAQQQVGARFQQKFQRAMSQQEWTYLMQAVGYVDPDSTPITQDMLDAAFAMVDQFSGELPGPETPGPETPAPGITMAHAEATVRAAFRARFSRDLNPTEWQILLNRVGYEDGQPITQELIDRAVDYVNGLPLPTEPVEPTPWEGTGDGGVETPVIGEFSQEIRDYILSQLSGDLFDPNNPAYQAQRNSALRNSDRTRRMMRASAASRMEREGTLGSLGDETMRITRAAGEDFANRDAELMAGEVAANRQQRMHALGIGGNLAGQDDAMANQRALADLDAILRREGYNLQHSIAQMDIEERRLARQQGGLLGLIVELMDQGFNYTQLQALLNQNSILNLIGGA